MQKIDITCLKAINYAYGENFHLTWRIPWYENIWTFRVFREKCNAFICKLYIFMDNNMPAGKHRDNPKGKKTGVGSTSFSGLFIFVLFALRYWFPNSAPPPTGIVVSFLFFTSFYAWNYNRTFSMCRGRRAERGGIDWNSLNNFPSGVYNENW